MNDENKFVSIWSKSLEFARILLIHRIKSNIEIFVGSNNFMKLILTWRISMQLMRNLVHAENGKENIKLHKIINKKYITNKKRRCGKICGVHMCYSTCFQKSFRVFKQDLFINKKESIYIFYDKFESFAVCLSLRYRVCARMREYSFLIGAMFRDGFNKMRHCVSL